MMIHPAASGKGPLFVASASVRDPAGSGGRPVPCGLCTRRPLRQTVPPPRPRALPVACQPERGVPPVPVGPWTRRVAIFARARRGGLRAPFKVGVAHSPRRAAPARRRPQREEWLSGI